MRETLERRHDRALSRAGGLGTLGGRLHQAQPTPPPPPPGRQPSPGRGHTVAVSTIWASDKERKSGDIGCDGVDDQVQIQAAIDYCDSIGGGTVRLLGPYFVFDAAGVTLPPYVYLVGNGMYSTWIDVGGDFDAITVAGSFTARAGVIGLTMAGPFPAAGRGVVVNSGALLLDHVQLDYFDRAVEHGAGGDGYEIVNCRLGGVGNTFGENNVGIYAVGPSSSDLRYRVIDSSIGALEEGMYIGGSTGEDTLVSRSTILAPRGVRVGSSNRGPRFYDSAFHGDYTDDGITTDGSNTVGIVARCKFSSFRRGLYCVGSGARILDNDFELTAQEAIFSYSDGATIRGNRVYAPSYLNNNLYDGIYSDGDDVLIMENEIAGFGGGGGLPRYSLNLDVSNAARYYGNTIGAGATGAVNDAGIGNQPNLDGSANDWNRY